MKVQGGQTNEGTVTHIYYSTVTMLGMLFTLAVEMFSGKQRAYYSYCLSTLRTMSIG